MTNTTQQQSAQIIPFPARGRFAVAADRDEFAPTAPALRAPSAPAAKAVVSSGWYHEAAIQDERARRR